MRKLKILHPTEATWLSTGYATWSNEILRRLHATGKYEIAELGCFVEADDPKGLTLPWKFYGNLPRRGNQEEWAIFNRNGNINQFGKWKFEEVCLDFQPDIVFDIRDHWMYSFEGDSPYRRYFHWCIMPTVDQTPQNSQFLNGYLKADSVFTYTGWGLDVLKKTNAGINLIGVAPAGADIHKFVPTTNKRGHKEYFGLPGDSLIIGTLMRNQARKLFPNLFQAFGQFLRKAPKDISSRAFLLCHTSYPDWWNLPELLKENEIGHKVLFTYKCANQACRHYFMSFFMDAKGACPKCGNLTASMGNTHNGFDREEIANIYNAMDLYVQYATNEGFGMGQVEATACGVPLMSVNYSGMEDVVKKVGGYPIKVKSFQKEPETGCDKAIPDNDHLVELMIEFFSKPTAIRRQEGFHARKKTEEHYDWDKTMKVLEDFFDSIVPKPLEETWLSPLKLHKPIPFDAIQGTQIQDVVQTGIQKVLGRTDLTSEYDKMKLARDAQWGVINEGASRREFNLDIMMNEFKTRAEFNNFWENMRFEKLVKGRTQ